MANPEHLSILKQGTEVWNKWRRGNDIRPDLTRAILRGATLSVANLSGADLFDANLFDANLGMVNLRRANLRRANLRGAYLSMARLIEADLSEADLTGADLSEADLERAIFVRTHLQGTNLSGAIVNWTQFGGVDLSEALGLDQVRHRSRSTIGIDTIYRSKGNIPEVFLRGSGVPEDFFAFLSTLRGKPIEFYSCFISYSHADKSFARRIHDGLQAMGIRCWLDEKQMLPGDDIYEQVDRGIRLWDKVLLCCSRDSLRSWWVDDEITRAFKKEQ
jgi:uncharacterized protein YjbI with pentapeptide repeats